MVIRQKDAVIWALKEGMKELKEDMGGAGDRQLLDFVDLLNMKRSYGVWGVTQDGQREPDERVWRLGSMSCK